MLDFGLAQLAVEDSSAEPGSVPPPLLRAGTPAYMAPEQAAGGGASARSDQYSFCVALHEAVFGVRPTKNGVGAGSSKRAPRWLRQLLFRGLSVDPQARYLDMAALLAELSRKRRRAWPSIGLVALGLCVAVLSGALLQSVRSTGRRSPCADAAAPIAAIWDDARRQAVEAAFARSQRSFARASFERVDQSLGSYAQSLSAMHKETCEARLSRQQSDALSRLRQGCLLRRQQELRSLTTLLAQADASLVDGSVRLVSLLPPVEACADVARLELDPKLDDDVRARAETLFAELATAQTLRKAGRYGEGLVVAERAVAMAKKLAVRPLVVEALEEQGRLQKQLKQIAPAETSFRTALLEAEASRHDVAAARLWIELVLMIGFWQTKPAEARPLLPFARAAVERVGQPADLAGALENAMGLIEMAGGDTSAARTHQEKALALYEKAWGASHLKVIEPLVAMADVHRVRSENPQLLKVLKRAYDITFAAVGPEHPLVANALNNLAIAHHAMRDHAPAYEYIGRAITMLERTAPDAKYFRSNALHLMGGLLSDDLRYEEALPYQQRSLALAEETFGAKSPKLCYDLSNLAGTLANLGRAAEARVHAQRSIDIALAAYGEDHHETRRARTELAFVLRRSGDCAGSMAIWNRLAPRKTDGPEKQDEERERIVERGLCLLAQNDKSNARQLLTTVEKQYLGHYLRSTQSELLFALAQSLPDTERARAVELSLRAKELLSGYKSPTADRERARIDAFMAGRGARP